MKNYVAIFICLMEIYFVGGTHFRGGSISWEPVGNGQQIEVRYRFGWRLNFKPHYLCNEEAIRNETLIEGEGEMMLVKRDEDGDTLLEEIVKDPLDYICTDRFDEGNNGEFHWASGINSFRLNVTEEMGTEFELGYFSCCWIGVLNYERPRRWRMLTRIDLNPRPDNGLLNTSPVTSSLPLLRIQRGCEFIVDIPYYDADGDFVKCRWAKALKNECSPPNCGRPHEMFTLKDGSCMIHMDTELADVGWYAVAVMMEDFISPLSDKPLSSVPLHFLVRVDPGERQCNDIFTKPPKASCLAVTPDELFVYKATAKTMSSTIPVVDFASTSPTGMEKSLVMSEGDGVYSTEFSWVPPQKLNGKVETFCYSPFDAERFSGSEVCVEMAIGGVRPTPQGELSIPSSTGESLNIMDNIWQIVFDQEIIVNEEAYFIARIVDVADDVISHNVTWSDVNMDTESNVLVMTFWQSLSLTLDENRQYRLDLLPGVVKGTVQCMLPSHGGSWIFNTCVPPFPDSQSSIPSSSPENPLTVLDYSWNITFYQPILLNPDTTLLAQILDSEGQVYFNITTDDVIVTIPETSPNVLTFFTPFGLYLEEETEYEFRVPAGIVTSGSDCNLTSLEDSWKFNTTSVFVGGRRGPPQIRDPMVTATCYPTFMEVFVEKSQFGFDMDPGMITLDESFCYGMEHNDTHFRLGTTYGQCGTKAIVNEDNTRVSMVNMIKIPSSAYPAPEDNSIYPPTPHPNYEVRINCSIPSRRVSFVELSPNVSTIVFQMDNVGDFNFSLKMFPDDRYRNRYRVQDFPIEIFEDQQLYFEARAFAPKQFGPYLQSCVAAPTAHPYDNFRFTFIENGCPLARSVQFHESPYNTRIRFSLLAEELLKHGLNSQIFVHCDIRLCQRRRGECTPQCPTETNEIRPLFKRSVHSLALSDEYMDTDGPITIKHRKHKQTDPREDSNSLPWLQITLTCVTAFLSVVCLALIIIVLRLKASLHSASSKIDNRRIDVPFVLPVPTMLPESRCNTYE